jgi:hypothetical protein
MRVGAPGKADLPVNCGARRRVSGAAADPWGGRRDPLVLLGRDAPTPMVRRSRDACRVVAFAIFEVQPLSAHRSVGGAQRIR